MSGNFEEYIKLYNEADKASRQLHIALTDLSIKLAEVRQIPRLLLQPESGKWPTQDELRALCQAMQTKIAPLQAAFNALSDKDRDIAPRPHTVGKRK